MLTRTLSMALLLGSASLDAQPIPARPNVVVTNFTALNVRSQEGDSSALEWSLAELLADRLINTQTMNVRDRRAQPNGQTGLNSAASARGANDTASGGARPAGAQFLINGMLTIFGNAMRIEARAVDMRNAKVVALAVGTMKPGEDPRHLLDSLAEHLTRGIQSTNGAAANMPVVVQQAPVPGTTGTRASAGTANAEFSQAGLLTFGRALRLAETGMENQKAAIAMLRSAAAEAPALTRDVEQIVQRWGYTAPAPVKRVDPAGSGSHREMRQN